VVLIRSLETLIKNGDTKVMFRDTGYNQEIQVREFGFEQKDTRPAQTFASQDKVITHPTVTTDAQLSLLSSQKLRRKLQKINQFHSQNNTIKECGRFCRADGVLRKTLSGFTWSGFATCRSAMCPYCGAVKAKGHREEMKRVLERLYEADGSCLFATFTNSRDGRGLKDLYRLQQKVVSRMLQGSFKKKLEEKYGYEGKFSKPEVTIRVEYKDDGQGDFHPHLHLLMCFDRKLEESEIQEIDSELFRKWSTRIQKEGLKAYREFSRVEQPKNIEAMGSYITKLCGSLSCEMTSLETKKGKESVSYFGLMMLIGQTAPSDKQFRLIRLLREYQFEMKGTRFISVSRNLRKKYLPELFIEGRELTDKEVEEFFEQEAIQQEKDEAQIVIHHIPQMVGAAAMKSKLKDKILNLCEISDDFIAKFDKLCIEVRKSVDDEREGRNPLPYNYIDDVSYRLELLINECSFCIQ